MRTKRKICHWEKFWRYQVYQNFILLHLLTLRDLWPHLKTIGLLYLHPHTKYEVHPTFTIGNIMFTMFSDFTLNWPHMTCDLHKRYRVLVLTEMDQHTKYGVHSNFNLESVYNPKRQTHTHVRATSPSVGKIYFGEDVGSWCPLRNLNAYLYCFAMSLREICRYQANEVS